MERATDWVTKWVEMDGNSFNGFTEFVSTRLTGAINVSIPVWQERQLAAGKSARLELPWGIFDAKIKTVGEGTNIAPTYEPTTRFMNALQSDDMSDEDQMLGINADYLKLVQDWLAYGYHDADIKADLPAKEKGARIETTEIEYFLDSYMRLLANIAKDHQRDGKEYSIKFIEDFDFGEYRFQYKGDEITPIFVPSKAYKQKLKNDSASSEVKTGMAAMTSTMAGTANMCDFFARNRLAIYRAARIRNRK